ncbi:MAG: hypothetical protein RIB79_12910 [Allomuricauda sp.]|jgi:hypothetical protein
MLKQIFLPLLIICINFDTSISQELVASAPMQIKEYESTITIPALDMEKSLHILAISSNILTDNNLLHLKYDPNLGKISYHELSKPSEHTTKDVVGHMVTSENNIELFFHRKGKDEFTILTVSGEQTTNSRTVHFKLKKEKVVQYISENNEFLMLTVQRNSSILNLYEYNGDIFEARKFDLTDERFYDEDSKRVPLSELFNNHNTATISPDLPNKAITFGKKVKIFPNKDIITITLNNNKNATRIIHLDKTKGVATTDYAPLPTQKFADNISLSLKTNAFILGKKIYSLVFSRNLMVVDITDLVNKESVNQFEFSPDDEMTFKSSLSSVLPIGPVSIANSNTKVKTKDAKVFFRNLKASYHTGIYAENVEHDIVVKIGGYTPPSSRGSGVFIPGTTTASMDNSGNVSISSMPPMYMGSMGFSGISGGFEKHLLLDSDTYQILSKGFYEDIFERVKKFNKDTKTVQFESVVNFGDYYLYGFFDKKEKTYSIVKFEK